MPLEIRFNPYPDAAVVPKTAGPTPPKLLPPLTK